MRIKILVEIPSDYIAKLDEIGFEGLASEGYRQDFDFCLIKAIDEFIKKYQKKE